MKEAKTTPLRERMIEDMRIRADIDLCPEFPPACAESLGLNLWR